MLSVSVITCTWNSEPYIAQCIASVAAQQYRALEHVFVDGGSDDGTLDRIRAESGRARWVTGVKGGISNAMNEGVRLAGGDVIAHLHGDDYYLSPNVIEDVAREMESTGARWLFGRIVSDIDGRQVPLPWRMPRYSAARLIAGNFIPHPATFVRRDLFEQAGGFDSSLRYAMDYDLWLRLSRIAPAIFLDAQLAAFRRHSGGASTANALAAFEEDHEVRLRYVSGVVPKWGHDLIHVWRRLRIHGQFRRRSF